MMTPATADTIVHVYRRGGFAECVSRMGDGEFRRYQRALKVKYHLRLVSILDLVLNSLRVGFIFSAIIFVGYCLIFVLFFHKPVMVGIVAALVAGLLNAAMLLILSINWRMEEEYFRDVPVDDLDSTGLADALRHASRSYREDADMSNIAADVIRWLEHGERRYAEVGKLTDTVYADDEKARERLHAVTDMEYLAIRRRAVESFEWLDRRVRRLQRIRDDAEKLAQDGKPVPKEDVAVERNIRRELAKPDLLIPMAGAMEPVGELDYTRLVLEMASRGVPVSCKEGDEGYDEAKRIADAIYGELLEAATDSVLYAFPADFDMLGELNHWHWETAQDGEKTGE